MIRKINSLIILLAAATANSFAQLQVGDWKLYNVFSSLNVQNIVDTGDIVYYLADGYLFSYGKSDDETIYYNKRNDLSDNGISNIYYNYDKNYLLITYSNSNIDFLYDDGKVVNMSDLKNTTMMVSKAINDVDFSGDEVYVSTDFGYMVLDDNRYMIKESFNYGKQFYSMIATDKYLYACFDKGLWVSEKEENHFYVSSFKQTNLKGNFTSKLRKISNNAMVCGSGYPYYMTIGNDDNITYVGVKVIKNQSTTFFSRLNNNYIFSYKDYFISIDKDGNKINEISLPSELLDGGLITSMESDGSLWGVDKNGLKKFKIEDDGSYTIMKDSYRPNCPTVSYPAYLKYQNNRLYVMSSGPSTFDETQNKDFGLCVLDNGNWKDLAPTEVTGLINSHSNGRLLSPYGLTVDSDDPDAVWFGTWWEGVFCVKDNKIIQRFDNSNSPIYFNYICNAPDIKNDGSGNLFVLCNNELDGSKPQLMMLDKSKKFSNVTANDWSTKLFQNITVPKYGRFFITRGGNVLMANNLWKTNLVIFDYNATISNPADDTQKIVTNFTDQDGKTFDIGYFFDFKQDADGRIWLATNVGVGYINENNLFSDNFYINRVKVPRNDGTNLADYLLDGLYVSSIAIDGANRKWFGTRTAGVYLVSADGSEILQHFTAENSYLPSDAILSIECNTENNSVYIGTDKGLVEYSSDAMPSEADYSNVYAYPNPVRPDYTGYITIRGLMENSLVKIADSAGNVVYSAMSNGGMVTWDGCNSNGKRVDTGVYFVLASQGDGEGCVTKIMVVR